MWRNNARVAHRCTEFCHATQRQLALCGQDRTSADFAKVHTSRGRSDAVICLGNKVIVLEFKLAERTVAVERAMNEGRKQLIERDYAQGYAGDERQVLMAMLVPDDDKRRATASTVA